ncbi:MAG: hypothetical protein P1U35_06485 [Cycloclasticus sp.]|jgi:hypothetical protein|nr:hypothetical protein [Cycloclasticus sp.]
MARAYLALLIIVFATGYALADNELPDEDLLEFLADWETEQGKWIDPEDLANIKELPTETEVQHEKNVQ